MIKFKVKKVITKVPCYVCSEVGGIPTPRSKCKACKGTGWYKESHYYIYYTGKDGIKYCIDADGID